jgi:hypothetical protein
MSRSPARKRLLIGLAVAIVALLVAGTDVWAIRHFGANAATDHYPDNYLNAIACPSAAQCWAVGQTASAPGGNTLAEARHPLLQHETAGTWRNVSLPGLGRRAALEAVACPGASDCWAVGGSSASGPAIIVHWTGGTWELASSPALKGGQLDSISCASTAACWATGGTQSRSGVTADVLEVWNGSRWALASTVAGGLQPTEFSCAAPGHCLALGLRHGVAAAATYSGGGWTAAPAPSGGTGPGAAAIPSLLGCASPAMCVAAFPGSHPVTETWNGRTWTRVTASLPAYPSGLSCSRTGGCWLLGMTVRSRPLALKWQGSAWTPVAMPAARRHGYLNAAACGSRCWAVGGRNGTRVNGGSFTYPLIQPLA